MKYQLLVLVVFAVAVAVQSKDVSNILILSEERKKEVRGYIESCLKETGAQEWEINRFEGRHLNIEPENENCFFACYHKRFGSMDKDGFYTNTEVLKDVFSPENYEIARDCCLEYNSLENVCSKAFKAHMCYLKKSR